MAPGSKAEIDAGYELSTDRLRVWVGNLELRVDNQWASLLSRKARRAVDIDLVRFGGGYDGIASRVDLHVGALGLQLGVTGRFGTRGEQRVRQAAAEAAAVIGRLAK